MREWKTIDIRQVVEEEAEKTAQHAYTFNRRNEDLSFPSKKNSFFVCSRMALISLPKKFSVFFFRLLLIQIRIKIWNFFHFLLPFAVRIVCGLHSRVSEK
jgi:hypothetical protein